ncbi:MAG: hypothetical protein M1493_05790 [Firmicutes bacterium]|nr:hypothetical protein [Bacillota bacterium]
MIQRLWGQSFLRSPAATVVADRQVAVLHRVSDPSSPNTVGRAIYSNDLSELSRQTYAVCRVDRHLAKPER